MLARLCLILTILFAGDSTLPNGIRVYELPGSNRTGNSFEVIAGYRTGVHGADMGDASAAAVVAAYLKSSPSARAMAVSAYGAGGEIEFFSDLNRIGIRMKMPAWARPMVEEGIADFLSETPQKHPVLLERALEEVRSRTPPVMPAMDVRSRVEEQFRIAMLGAGAKSDLPGISSASVQQYFEKNFGTDRAFVLMDAPSLRSLQNVLMRTSAPGLDSALEVESAARPVSASSLRVQSDLDEGAVILGSPVPSIYYRDWYRLLMLDRLIQQAFPGKPTTVLLPSLDFYYYRIEVSVPSGQLAASVESALLQDLDQMQYVRASSEQLESARRSAIQYLESESVQRWFQSLGVPDRRVEGIDWLRGFSADDMRSAARDLVEPRPVIASWSPRLRVLKLDAENLSDIASRAVNLSAQVARPLAVLGPADIIPFPPHADGTFVAQASIRLESGVSVVGSSSYAVFVAPNSLTRFDSEPGSDVLQTSFGAFRPDRILVLAPPESLERVKQQWTRFQGNLRDRTVVSIRGSITSADIPALLLLKMILDRRLIEAGLWNDVQLQIHAAEGSTLLIQANDTNRRIVLEWIREVASRPIPESEFDWAREAAVHHLPGSRADLQSLVWEWNPDGVFLDVRSIPASQVQEVARIYLDQA